MGIPLWLRDWRTTYCWRPPSTVGQGFMGLDFQLSSPFLTAPRSDPPRHTPNPLPKTAPRFCRWIPPPSFPPTTINGRNGHVVTRTSEGDAPPYPPLRSIGSRTTQVHRTFCSTSWSLDHTEGHVKAGAAGAKRRVHTCSSEAPRAVPWC